jgi:hypothetical protein
MAVVDVPATLLVITAAVLKIGVIRAGVPERGRPGRATHAGRREVVIPKVRGCPGR